jgi:hypothetical protein
VRPYGPVPRQHCVRNGRGNLTVRSADVPQTPLLRHAGEESEVEVALLKQLDARVLITCLRASRAFSEFVPRAKLS